MSFQAVTWAIEQRAGGPSAKAVLWSIANYANEAWCSWPSQKTIGGESEQSADAVQRRIPELEEAGLVRRIPLHFHGRRSVDFFILRPSRFFSSSLDEIEPLLPRGYSVAPKHATADRGSVESATKPAPSGIPCPDAAADRGSDTFVAAANAAANAAALQRQQEPFNHGVLDVGVTRAREAPLISEDAHTLAGELATIAGHDLKFLPPRWMSDGPAMRVQMMIDQGWQREMMIETAQAVMRVKRDGSPATIKYFEKPFASAHARQSAQPPLPNLNVSTESKHATTDSGWRASKDAFRSARAELKAHIAGADQAPDARSEGSGPDVRPVAAARRG